MDLKDIKRIIELMKENEITDFEMEQEGQRLALKRKNGGEATLMMAAPAAPALQAMPAAAALPAAAPAAAPAPAEDAGWVDIKSPIVGTFYRSPSPEAESYVTVGQEVDEETVVCIIEAMKVMNEIKAECRGVVRKIVVENATSVHFGQVLFKVEPA